VMCTWCRGDKSPSLDATLHVVEVPDLIELVGVFALDDHIYTPRRLECRHDGSACIRSCCTWHNARIRKPCVAGQSLEQVHGRGEVVYDLFLHRIVGVAARLECADACAMFLPFVIPEALVVAVDVLPVCVHIAEHIRCACSSEDGGDIGVGSAGVAVGVIGAVAVVRPQAMDGP